MPPYQLTDETGLVGGDPDISTTLIGDEMAVFHLNCRLDGCWLVNPREIMLQCRCGNRAYLVFDEDVHCDISHRNLQLTIFFR